jgi:hypothetical protein
VVVFKPPPVDPGEAPILIKTISTRVLASGRVTVEEVLKPAVLAVTLQNHESDSAPLKKSNKAPETSNTRLTRRVNLVWIGIR